MIKAIVFGAIVALTTPAALFAGDPMVNFEHDDSAMNAAIAQAHQTMETFLSHVTNANGRASETATVKVSFPTDYGDEIIWVENFTLRSNGKIIGFLANAPNYLPNLSIGDKVSFKRDDLRDWGVFANGKLYGHYTTRTLLPHLASADRAHLNDLLSAQPLPANW